MWKHPNLPKAAIVVNLSEGTSAVLQIFCAVVADAYLGRFTVVVSAAITYTIGLLLCSLAARGKAFLALRIFYTALTILTLAQSALKISLKTFLGDQILARSDQPSTEEEKERAEGRSNFWWNFAATLAGIVFGVLPVDSFQLLTFASAILMAVAFVWFLLGTKFYYCIEPTGSPLISNVPPVICAAIIKRNVAYPRTSDQLFQNTNNLVQVLPHVSWLRWLDKAAVVQQENSTNLCTVKQVKGVKFLLKVLPIWTTFIIFSVVAACGSTFFLEEAYHYQSDDQGTRFQYFILLQSLARFVSDFLLNMCKWKNVQKVMLVRIGIGMICSVLCCITACVNAAYWLHLVNLYDEPASYMSVYRLIPQFILLGLMEGLSQRGLEKFFDSQVSDSISRYGPPFGELMMGVGKFMSVVCILIFHGWINNDISSSHLDKYYAVLAAFSFINLLIYSYAAYWYGDDRFFEEEDDIESYVMNVGQDIAELLVGLEEVHTKSGGRDVNEDIAEPLIGLEEVHAQLGGLNVDEVIVEPLIGRSLSNKVHYNSSQLSTAFQRKTRSFR
ncbi:hypothetical protein BUALT_Bualt02G0021200 [Buddleja alternifolia]|uniref:Uncharacterized protein n=1 Tax=Buddleja alternifolia TaxID=168488 RepID=A0AAV6Y3H4_9LAMI|nr:hypothetical protein BUALT_Bualt02G0021200 [Buddleja alternifolia]